MLKIILDDVKYGTAPIPLAPDEPGGEPTVGKLLEFFDEQSGIVIDIPLRPKVVEDLVRQLSDQKVAPVSASALDALKATVPEPGANR